MHPAGCLSLPVFYYEKRIQYQRHRIYRNGRRAYRNLQDGTCFPAQHRAHIILARNVHTSHGLKGFDHRADFRSDRSKPVRSSCLGHNVPLCMADTDAAYHEVPQKRHGAFLGTAVRILRIILRSIVYPCTGHLLHPPDVT